MNELLRNLARVMSTNAFLALTVTACILMLSAIPLVYKYADRLIAVLEAAVK